MWHPSPFCGLPASVRPLSLRPASQPPTIFLHTATSGLCSSFAVFRLATACGSIRPSRVFPCMSNYGNIRPFIVFLASPQPAVLAVSALSSCTQFMAALALLQSCTAACGSLRRTRSPRPPAAAFALCSLPPTRHKVQIPTPGTISQRYECYSQQQA